MVTGADACSELEATQQVATALKSEAGHSANVCHEVAGDTAGSHSPSIGSWSYTQVHAVKLEASQIFTPHG